MIPNFAPVAVVYHSPTATGSRDGKLFSRPVVAWEGTEPLVPDTQGSLVLAASTLRQDVFLGLWLQGWAPSYEQMSSLLPEPEPERIYVTAKQLTDGSWFAYRTINGLTLATSTGFEELKEELENHHLDCFIENVLPLTQDLEGQDPSVCHVTLYQTAAIGRSPGVWEARLTANRYVFVDEAPDLDTLRARMTPARGYIVDSIVPLAAR